MMLSAETVQHKIVQHKLVQHKLVQHRALTEDLVGTIAPLSAKINRRSRRTFPALVIVLLCTLTTACEVSERKDPETPSPSSPPVAESEGGVAAAHLGSPDAEVDIDAILGSGAVPVGWERRDFQLGDTLVLLVEMLGVPEASRIEVRWLGPALETVDTETKLVGASGSRILPFTLSATSEWKPGAYLVEVRLDGRLVDRYPFTVSEVHRGSGTEPPKEEWVLIDVFYGTDRAPSGEARDEDYYGSQQMPGDKVNLGICQVSVPLKVHETGEVERPVWWKLERRADPKKHMKIWDLDPLPAGSFYRLLSSAVEATGDKQALVFVHGFNVSFTTAVLRTAQIVHDLAFDGVAVTFSWPSYGVMSVAKYHFDVNNVSASVPHLEAFLNEVAERSGASRIHLIAHSLGNHALTAALQRIAARRSESQEPLFNQIVLTAPDVDARVFAQLAREFTAVGERTTLYASSNDRALKFSRRINGHPRAGDTAGGVVVVPGVDTIDVSAVDTTLIGHFYYGDNRSFLSDLFYLLRNRSAPDDRFGLSPREINGMKYWVFQP